MALFNNKVRTSKISYPEYFEWRKQKKNKNKHKTYYSVKFEENLNLLNDKQYKIYKTNLQSFLSIFMDLNFQICQILFILNTAAKQMYIPRHRKTIFVVNFVETICQTKKVKSFHFTRFQQIFDLFTVKFNVECYVTFIICFKLNLFLLLSLLNKARVKNKVKLFF